MPCKTVGISGGAAAEVQCGGVSPDPVEPGGTATATFTVQNISDFEALVTVAVEVDGSVVATEEFRLIASETLSGQTIDFQAPSAGGTVSVETVIQNATAA